MGTSESSNRFTLLIFTYEGFFFRPVAKIGCTRCLCGQNRVPFYFSVRHAPRTPFDWPTPASTRRWPHCRRVDPILATQLPKGTRYLYPTTRKWPGFSTKSAHHAASEFHPSSSLCYRRSRTRIICLMPMIWFSRPQTTTSSLPLSNRKSHLSTALSLSFQPKATSAQRQYRETDHERRYRPPIAKVLS